MDFFKLLYSSQTNFSKNSRPLIFSSFSYRIPFTAIRSAASQKRAFTLWYFDQFATETTLELKLSSSLSANELYRALTEKHAFYSCETVRGAVTSQFIRDLKVCFTSIHLHFFFAVEVWEIIYATLAIEKKIRKKESS